MCRWAYWVSNSLDDSVPFHSIRCYSGIKAPPSQSTDLYRAYAKCLLTSGISRFAICHHAHIHPTQQILMNNLSRLHGAEMGNHGSHMHGVWIFTVAAKRFCKMKRLAHYLLRHRIMDQLHVRKVRGAHDAFNPWLVCERER